MVELSQGWTLAPPDYLVPRELQIAIANLFSHKPIAKPVALGRGVAFAFGRSDKLHDDLGISKERADALQAFLDSPSGLTELLIGDDEPLNIRSVNNFYRTATSLAQRVETARAEGKNYSRAVRKRAYVARLTIVLQPELTRVLSLYGKGLDDFLNLGKNRLMAFFEEIPTLNTEIELVTQRDEHWDRRVDPNDMVDVSVLSVAIPYCDIVVTERFWADLAKRKKLDKKYDTVVLSDLSELEEHLNGDAA